MVTIATTCSVGPDGPEESVWISLDGEHFLPVNGCDGWREWDEAPADIVQGVRELFEPDHDPISGVTRHMITWSRRVLAMSEVEFHEFPAEEAF